MKIGKLFTSLMFLIILCAAPLLHADAPGQEAPKSASIVQKGSGEKEVKAVVTSSSKASSAAKQKASAPVSSRPSETVTKGLSIDSLQGPRLAAAMGFFSRAHSLLLSAVREFDQGLKIANPDLLMNSDAWRRSVLDQAVELEKVLSPSAAAPKGGVKYPGDSRLLSESVR